MFFLNMYKLVYQQSVCYIIRFISCILSAMLAEEKDRHHKGRPDCVFTCIPVLKKLNKKKKSI